MSDPWNGLPQNPERDGWHWLRRKGEGYLEAWEWSNYCGTDDEYQWQTDGDGCPDAISPWYDYLGPCVTPADLAAAEAAAAEAMREKCVAEAKRGHERRLDGGVETEIVDRGDDAIADAIRAIPTPSPDALARYRADVIAEDREAIAKWYEDEGWQLDEGNVADAIRARGAGQ